MTQRELICASDGYRIRQDEEWERVRVLSFYMVTPYAKKGFTMDKIYIPGDDDRKEKHLEKKRKKKKFERIKLTREQVREEWERAGLELSEEKLDEIMNNGK